MNTITGQTQANALLKDHLASKLKQAIVHGALEPGGRVIEGKWAKEFGVAQASVREAINLLIAEGFLVKDSGRSARVVNYREQDIAHIYEVRAAIEGLAAELACAKRANLTGIQSAFDDMIAASTAGDIKALVHSDMHFHLALLDAAQNPLVTDIGRKLLFPLFAFMQMRAVSRGRKTEAWSEDLQYHEHILFIMREGNAALAGQYVQHCLRKFTASAYEVWAPSKAEAAPLEK